MAKIGANPLAGTSFRTIVTRMKNKTLISVIAIITFIVSTQVKYLYAYALFG
jgi:hypothetical protein